MSPNPNAPGRWLAALSLAVVLAAAANAQVTVSLGPTVNWTEDVSTLTDDGTTVRRDSLRVPVTLGLQAGLGATVRRGRVGVRLGGRFLNTALFYDGERTLDREALASSFLTVQVDLEYSRSLGPLRAYAFAGPEVRYLLDLSGDVESLRDVRDGLDLLSTAANLGAGLRLNVFGFRAGPELRYAVDLTGVGGDPTRRDDGSEVRLSEAFDVNTLLVGLVIGR